MYKSITYLVVTYFPTYLFTYLYIYLPIYMKPIYLPVNIWFRYLYIDLPYIWGLFISYRIGYQGETNY
jgi:hypothetical protein